MENQRPTSIPGFPARSTVSSTCSTEATATLGVAGEGNGRRLAWVGVVIVLAASAILWWLPAGEIYVQDDDRLLLASSREIARGRWEQLLAPQDVHVIPLYRLARLYFDLHFPGSYRAFHLVVVGAHLASTLFLFLLSRRFLEDWAALVSAGLFAFHTLGAEAFLIKSQSPFVLSLPFLLGGCLALCLMGEGDGWRWAWVAGLSLTAAVGLHSTAAAAAVAGVGLGYHLWGRRVKHQAMASLAWVAPLLLGIGLWMAYCLPELGTAHGFRFPGVPRSAAEVASRVADLSNGTAWHVGVLLLRRHWGPGILTAGAAGLLAVIVLLRRRRSSPWILTALALTLPPLALTFAVRGAYAYHLSRYCYQSFVLVAVVAGAVLEAILAGAGRRARWAALVLLVAAAPVYYATQVHALRNRIALLRTSASTTGEFWRAWSKFFEQAGTAGPPLRLPALELEPGWRASDVLEACYPRGHRGIVVLRPEQTRPEDCRSFWEAARGHVPMPQRLEILTSAGHAPAGDAVVCRALGPP